MAGFFLRRWRGLTVAGNPEQGPAPGWREVAVVLARELRTPLPMVLKMTLAEAAEWSATLRRLEPTDDP